ncbi:MAG: 3-deoxy-manno-octulosonate cytidylyltransferase [Candidatus Acidiferrales bacterium]
MIAENAEKIVAVVPARYESSRFPGKPLAMIAGKTMIEHVVERVQAARGITRVVVATDDERIAGVVKDFGGATLMTRHTHRCGTERVAEVAATVKAEIYLDVQGDEPLVDPRAVEAAIAVFGNPEVQIATLCTPFREPAELTDANVVKLVTDLSGDALYFSRAPIPWDREGQSSGTRRISRGAFAPSAPYRKHIGLYAFRRAALLRFPELPQGRLEKFEQLEQLRWLENGFRIRAVETDYDAISVDVPSDVARVEKILAAKTRS